MSVCGCVKCVSVRQVRVRSIILVTVVFIAYRVAVLGTRGAKEPAFISMRFAVGHACKLTAPKCGFHSQDWEEEEEVCEPQKRNTYPGFLLLFPFLGLQRGWDHLERCWCKARVHLNPKKGLPRSNYSGGRFKMSIRRENRLQIQSTQ